MIDIEIVHDEPYIEIVINMESDYGFNREVIITDRITSSVTRRHPNTGLGTNNQVSHFEIDDVPRVLQRSPTTSSLVSSENKYDRISLKVIDEPSHYNWIAFIGLSLALFSTIQGMSESISMFLAIDHSSVEEHRNIPAYGHLALAYLFLFNAALVLSLWCCENLVFIIIVWAISIMSWILSTYLMLNNYGMNMLQLIWKSFQETSSTYDKIMVSSWTQRHDDATGIDKFIFPDSILVGLACAQNGSILCIKLLLIFCIATTMAMLIDFQHDLKDSGSASSISPMRIDNNSNILGEKYENKAWLYGLISGLFIFFGLFSNFSLFLINNLYVYSNMHVDSHPYEVYAGGPRYAMFFGLTAVGLLSLLYYMTHSKWVKFILFIFSILSLGCAIYSVFALRVWYGQRLNEDGVYKELRDCGIKPHEQNNEFCVFNCTFSRQTDDSNNSQNRGVICNELCIPFGIIQKLHLFNLSSLIVFK